MLFKHSIDYSIGQYSIRINLWLMMIFLLLQTLLNSLGFWQMDRSKEKRERIMQLEKGSQNPLQSLTRISSADLEAFKAVELELETNYPWTLLLENQIKNKAHGYHVLNMVTDKKSGKQLLVNRGWVFGGNDRNRLPKVEEPPADWLVKARLYPLVESVKFSQDAEIERIGSVLRLPKLDQTILQQLNRDYGLSLENYVLRLTGNDTQASLNTGWVWTNMPPEKHLAYAFQWFGLALTLFLVSFFACIKKVSQGD
jgi:surfeit locus 1 family protein